MKRFKRIYIEITDVCDRQCSFCVRSRREKEFMTEAMFSDIIGKIRSFTDHVCLHVLGEPLLHPDLERFLEICQENQLQVNLVTNGSNISICRDILLSKVIRKISFSLHSIRDGQVDDILDFAKQSKGRYISLRLWNGAADNSAILEKVKSAFGIEKIPADLKLTKDVFLDPAEQFSWPSLDVPYVGTSGFCLALRDQLAILVDGTVVPCCLDAEGVMALGNIRNSSLSDILSSVRAEGIYDGFSRREAVEPLCRHCSFRKRFDR